jgi:ribosomal-protein-serine acetyltransferase
VVIANLGGGAKLVMLEVQHAPAMLALIEGNRSHLREFLPFVDGTRGVQDLEEFIEGSAKRFARDSSFDAGIFQGDELAGVIGLHYVNWRSRITSVGYWLGAQYQGRGLMTRSVNAILEHAFDTLGLNRVASAAATENARSNAVLKRCGFQLEGLARDAEWLYDHYVNHNLYGLLERDWRASREG